MAYMLIASQALAAAQGDVTFSNIPGTYKDLFVEFCGGVDTTQRDFYLRFNGDTGSNYSNTYVLGTGTTTTANASNNQTSAYCWYSGVTIAPHFANIMSYANTNVNKTVLNRFSATINATGDAAYVGASVNLWRSTNAITSVTVGVVTGTMSSGATLKLWGIS